MTRRALVVDDDKYLVKTLADVLRFKGWEVATAYSGTDAVKAAAQDRFDVVLMDIKMPGMDGVDALKVIRAQQPEVKVVLMTAYAAQDRLEEAERAGALRILPKPVDPAALLDLISTSLHGAQPVLLLDHDATFLKTLSDVLRMRGFDVVVADNLEHASQVMEERQPVAVLLHMHLGAIPPQEAVAAVRSKCPAMALILYSGQAGAEDEVEGAVPAGWIHTYLQKPFGVDEVTGVLDAIRKHG